MMTRNKTKTNIEKYVFKSRSYKNKLKKYKKKMIHNQITCCRYNEQENQEIKIEYKIPRGKRLLQMINRLISNEDFLFRDQTQHGHHHW